MKKIIFWIVVSITVLSLFLILLQYYNQPECYLIEQDEKCGFGYWVKVGCWSELHLRECCKGDDYILKGVYGDKTCWWLMAGQPELNTTFQ